MSAPELKKTIAFSTIKTRRLIEGMIEDIAIVNGRSKSDILEKKLLEGLMTKSSLLNTFIEDIYGGGENIGRTLDKIFSTTSAGLGYYDARYTDVLPIIALMNEWIRNMNGDCNVNEKFYLTSSYEMVLKKMKKEMETQENDELKFGIEYGRNILSNLSDSFRKKDVQELIWIIISQWDVIKNFSYTHRLLGSISRAFENEWPNTPEARMSLVNTFKTMETGWMD